MTYMLILKNISLIASNIYLWFQWKIITIFLTMWYYSICILDSIMINLAGSNLCSNIFGGQVTGTLRIEETESTILEIRGEFCLWWYRCFRFLCCSPKHDRPNRFLGAAHQRKCVLSHWPQLLSGPRLRLWKRLRWSRHHKWIH